MTYPLRIFACLSLALTAIPTPARPQDQKKSAPDFTLTLSAPKEVWLTENGKVDLAVSVEERNISKHVVATGRTPQTWLWYKMNVLFNGQPASTTEHYKELTKPVEPDPHGPTGSMFLGSIAPGKAQTFRVDLSNYYDMNSPGEYQITFSRGTSPEVVSNTITITVHPYN